MAPEPTIKSTIVIGAGLAGLLAARTLNEAGVQTVVLDKSRGVGGRMATRRSHEARFDHGAQYFTVRSSRFEQLVQAWLDAGVVRRWSSGFPDWEKESGDDGLPRYCGSDGMATIAKYLAIPLDVRLNARIEAVDAVDGAWRVTTAGCELYEAKSLIVTAPMPQALDLLDRNGTTLPAPARAELQNIQYDRCITVMALLDEPSRIPEPGGLRLSGEPIRWIADNARKGISPGGHAVTIQAGPEFSRTFFDADDFAVSQALLEAAAEWLPGRNQPCQVHRWRYSRPLVVHPKSYFMLDDPAPLVFAGDGFHGSKIEGAALSGLAAAEALLTRAR